MHVLGPRAARSLLPELSLTRWGAASRSSLASASDSRKLASLQRALRRRPSLYVKRKQTINPQSSRLRFHARMKFLALPHIQPN